jgi:ElaB protein
MSKSRNALAQDFDNVVSDAQELLKTIGDGADARVVDAKTRMQASLSVAKDRLVELHDTVIDGANAAAKTTDEYVHGNPWPVIGASAALGIAVGYLLARR